jgi:hypothetical protein
MRSTTTFPRGPDPQRRQRKLTCFLALLRFKRNSRVLTPSPVRQIRAYSNNPHAAKHNVFIPILLLDVMGFIRLNKISTSYLTFVLILIL